MRFPALVISILSFCAFCKRPNNDSIHVDSVFVSWNKATIASLRLQAEKEERASLKDYYQNRLDAFYAYTDIQVDSQINKNAVRYKFLNYLKGQLKEARVIIIEATLSGEYVDTRNFVLYPQAKDKATIEVYRYDRNGWRKDKVVEQYRLTFDKSLLGSRVEWEQGFNHDDIIISHFQNGKVEESEYFLYGTLSGEGIERIIRLDK